MKPQTCFLYLGAHLVFLKYPMAVGGGGGGAGVFQYSLSGGVPLSS